MVADIIINITAKQVQQTFSYVIPDGLPVRTGSRVLVPFGPRREEGIVLAVREERDSDRQYQLKPVLSLLSSQAGFRDEMIQTALWISQYYLCGLADAMRLFMIEKKGITRRVYVRPGPEPAVTEEEKSIAAYVKDHSPAEKKQVCRRFAPDCVEQMIRQNQLVQEDYLQNQIADKTEKWLAFQSDDTAGILKRRPRQAALLEELKRVRSAPFSYWIRKGYSRDVLLHLCQSGCAVMEEKLSQTRDLTHPLKGDVPFTLTEEQQRAVDAVRNDRDGCTYVLRGVTGSGKTEVYMQLRKKY